MNKVKVPQLKLPAPLPRWAIILVSLFLTSVILFLVLFFIFESIGPKNVTQDWAINVVEASQEFNPGQAVTLNVDTVTVYVPPFAIPLPGSLFMIPHQQDLYPNASQPEWSRSQVVDVQFRNATGTPIPDIVLSAPIKICFKLTLTQWLDFAAHPDAYAIQYYAFDRDPPLWLNLPRTMQLDLRQLCGRTDQLAIFALGIHSEFSIPVTGPSATPSLPAAPDPNATSLPPTPNVLRERINEPGLAISPQPTPTLVPTRTLRPTATPTSTLRLTATPTSTLRLTATPTSTLNPTATSTWTPVPTATPISTFYPTFTPISTFYPTLTPISTFYPTLTSTWTPVPTATSTWTPVPTATPLPTATNPPPTATNPPPTATNPPPTATNPPPTATNPPPTATNVPPTAIPPTNPPPPTATNVPPTAIPPTNPPPPTATNVPPTAIPPTNPPPPTAIPPTNPPPPTDTQPAPTQPPQETPSP